MTRKQYTEADRREAVTAYKRRPKGMSLSAVAKSRRIKPSTMSDWVRAAQKNPHPTPVQEMFQPEQKTRKYRLRVPQLGFEAGAEFNADTVTRQLKIAPDLFLPLEFVERNPDLFEPVIERWMPKVGDRYFVVAAFDHVSAITWRGDSEDSKIWRKGNCFRTREQVEEAARRFKDLLNQYHEEIGE